MREIIMATKSFDILDILTITTGRLISPRHMDAVYDILNFMTNDDLMTHQLPRASDECKPYLLAQFPELASVQAPNIKYHDELPRKQAQTAYNVEVEAWRDQVLIGLMHLSETYEIEAIPQDDHDRIDPIEEVKHMVGKDMVIKIEVPAEPDEPSPYGDLPPKDR
jgi:hypothetical protein